MSIRLSALWTARPTPRPAAPPAGRPIFRPVLEGFEDRVVPYAPSTLGPAALVAPAAPAAASQTVIPININAVNVVNGALVAVGQVGNSIFNIPLDLTASPGPAGADCPILHLRINAIHLDLLGLNVDTSNICLDITAHHGALLGDLLCGVGNLLNGGTPLGDILGGLTGGQLSDLLGGLTGLLDGVFGQLTDRANVAGVSGSSPGSCDILNLSLGPIDLNLLGLEVALDNCANGPVTVDITAVPGAGNLLGNLLCGLSHLLDSNANPLAISNKLDKIIWEIGNLINL